MAVVPVAIAAALLLALAAYWLITGVEALQGIHRELYEMNRLRRDEWSDDYKSGRIEKPTKVRA
jgi:hypothetical protein